ncbi:MAG: diguanylate cyclase [bacterium]|nr:diguanylate cyclase [bacterium]
MIVENSLTQAMKLQYILVKDGYDVSIARNGKEALAAIEKCRPSMVVSAVVMTEMDGYELCGQIKANEETRDISVILLTSLSDHHDIIQGMQCGANNFIVKPYEDKFLLSRIRYILANQELRQVSVSEMGIEIFFGGQKHFITPDRIQIIDLLLNSYETAVQKNLELEQAKTNYRTLLETNTDAVVVIDCDKRICFVNPAAETLFACNAEELLDTTFEFPVKVNTSSEVEITGQHNKNITAEMRVVKTNWQGEDAYLALLRDITTRKQTEGAMQQRNIELLLLNRVSRIFGSSLKLEQVFETVLDEVQRLLDVYSVSLWLLEAEKNELVCMQSKGHGSDALVNQRLAFGQGITGWVAQQKTSLLVPDTWKDARHLINVDKHTGVSIRSMISIPLLTKGAAIGVLNLVDSRVDYFSKNELTLLEPVAAAAAIAIENAHLYTTAQQELAERRRTEQQLRKTKEALEAANQELLRLATLDGLTQIANRRRFDEYLDQEWRRNIREQAPLSLILGDIDYFKPYNDTYGHQAGDDCLKQVAQTMDRTVNRVTDLVARYGGEEFAVILPHTDSDAAMHIAQTIQDAIHALNIPHGQSSAGKHVTLSLGVVCCIPTRESSSELLVAAADKSLYQAKEQGRNRIVFNTSMITPHSS